MFAFSNIATKLETCSSEPFAKPVATSAYPVVDNQPATSSLIALILTASDNNCIPFLVWIDTFQLEEVTPPSLK